MDKYPCGHGKIPEKLPPVLPDIFSPNNNIVITMDFYWNLYIIQNFNKTAPQKLIMNTETNYENNFLKLNWNI